VLVNSVFTRFWADFGLEIRPKSAHGFYMIPELLARALASSSPVRLNSMAAEYGLKSVSGVWWVRKSVTHPVSRQERQFKKSTKRTDLRDALAVAVPWVDRWLAEVQTDRAEPLGVKREWATLGEVVDFYLTWPNGRQHTRDRCARELGTMAGECWPDREWRGISTEMLTRDERLKWRQMRELASAKAHLPADAEAHERTKRNINQMIANTSGVFSRAAREAYHIAGIRVHDAVLGWLDVRKLKAKPAAPPEPLGDAVMAKIAKELPGLKERAPGAWAAVMLMFFAGVRNIEAVAARWSWLGEVELDDSGEEVRGFRLESAGEHLSKQSDGLVPVRVAVWKDLASVRHLGQKGEDFIVPGATVTARIEAAYYEASEFLKGCGVEKRRGKTTYRLRGKAISLMGALYGDKAAARYARHKDEKTTRENYTGTRAAFVSMPAMAGAAVEGK
jgi:hypothetical protein